MPIKQDAARILRGVARRLDPPPPAAAKKPAKQVAKKAQPAKAAQPAKTAQPAATAQQPTSRTPKLPPSSSAPGSMTTSNFFDAYPRVYEGESGPKARRNNLRYEAIVAPNPHIFKGARILDIGSHDGRWAIAALANGAQSVVGIEARPEFTAEAESKLATYGYGPDQGRFICGNVYDVLANEQFEVDVVMCLGYLYHTLRYNELLYRIRQANARYVVIDSRAFAIDGKDPVMYAVLEGQEFIGNAVLEQYSYGDKTLTGRPNFKAIQVIMRGYGYQTVRRADWTGIIRDNGAEGVGDYAAGQRTTVVCVDENRPDPAF